MLHKKYSKKNPLQHYVQRIFENSAIALLKSSLISLSELNMFSTLVSATRENRNIIKQRGQ